MSKKYTKKRVSVNMNKADKNPTGGLSEKLVDVNTTELLVVTYNDQ